MGAARPRRRSAPRRTSRSPSRTRPSARSSASRAARRSRRSTPSRCARPRRSVADEPQLPTEEELRDALDAIGVADILAERAVGGRVDRLPPRLARGARSRAGAARDRGAARARPGAARGRCGRGDRARSRAGAREPPARVREAVAESGRLTRGVRRVIDDAAPRRLGAHFVIHNPPRRGDSALTL